MFGFFKKKVLNEVAPQEVIVKHELVRDAKVPSFSDMSYKHLNDMREYLKANGILSYQQGKAETGHKLMEMVTHISQLMDLVQKK